MSLAVKEIDLFAASFSNLEKNSIEVWIAAPEPVMSEIEVLLEEYDFYNYKRVTSNFFAELMKSYFTHNEKFIPLSVLTMDVSKERLCEVTKCAEGIQKYVQVFMAKFYKDKQLTKAYSMPKWVTPIQVGATLCNECVAEVLDCEGENISHKNGNYSELTALYWMWKKMWKQYYLIQCHMNRIFMPITNVI